MKTCPYCQKNVPVRAARCPHCTSQFTAEQMEDGRRQHSRRRNVKFLVVLGVLVAAIYMLATRAFSPGAIDAAAERDAQQELTKP
jgi:predicted amidophosphoribosyltransferase